jgi:aspartate ammonia-lyase
LGHKRGEYFYLHPIEHVNLSQSTNDVYPTAVRIALWKALQRLRIAMGELRDRFTDKAEEFAGVVKLGRTQLQDAVPMTLGQEFSTYSVMLEEDMMRLAEASAFLLEINLGATAIGTGINAPPHYAQCVLSALREITGMSLRTSTNLVEATQDCGVFILVSGVMKRIAAKLSKTCNDLRLLSSGPRAGLGEIRLPAVQAGSSIMPGKINPVIPETINQIAFEVFGSDVTVTFAAEAGQLQLNAFEPIIAYSLLRSAAHLTNGCTALANLCIKGIEANAEYLQSIVERSTALATALNPVFGYKIATSVAAEAQITGETVREVVLRRKLMDEEQIERLLRPESLIHGEMRGTHSSNEIRDR